MTDDEMDARLHAAGAAWRTATESPPRPAEPHDAPIPTAPSRRHRTAWLASAAVIAAALVAGGAFLLGRTTGGDHQRVGAESAALEGTVWRLVGYGGHQQRADSLATLYLGRDGSFVADDACQLVTALHTGGAEPELRVVRVRDYDCTDAGGEPTFARGLPALQAGPHWSVIGDRLTVTADGVVMHLVAAPNLPAPTADRPTFTGASWRLAAVTDAAGRAKTFTTKADLRIDNGRLLASDTCNALSGAAHVDGTALRIKDGLGQSYTLCPDDDTQSVVDAVLVDGAHLALHGGTLTVTKPGAGTLTYRWQPADAAATDPSRLTAVEWRLRSVAGVPAGTDVTIRFSGGKLFLAAPCEGASGSAGIGAGVLRPKFPEQPRAGCPPELTTLHSLLASGSALWHVAGDRLVIDDSGAQGFALVFTADRRPAGPAAQLAGRPWTLQGVAADSGNSASGSGSSDTGITIAFTPTGYHLQTRCPVYDGAVTIDDHTLVFGARSQNDGATLSCKPAYLDQVLHLLQGPVRWKIAGGQLSLTKGAITVTFAR